MYRRSGLLAAAIAFNLLVCSSVNAQKAAKERLEAFQIAAGTVLQARITTPVDSATAPVNDQVDATLTEAAKQDGTELIPVGSRILGKVVAVAAASRRNPLWQVVITFTAVEHGTTGSRAAIETSNIVLRAELDPAEREDRRARKRLVEARPNPTQVLAVRLAEPLIVYIPQ